MVGWELAVHRKSDVLGPIGSRIALARKIISLVSQPNFRVTFLDEQDRRLIAVEKEAQEKNSVWYFRWMNGDLEKERLQFRTEWAKKEVRKELENMLSTLSELRFRFASESLAGLNPPPSSKQTFAEFGRKVAEYWRTIGMPSSDLLDAGIASDGSLSPIEALLSGVPKRGDEVVASIPLASALIDIVRYVPLKTDSVHPDTRWGEPRYMAYVATRGQQPKVVDLGSAAEIDALVKDFRFALTVYQSDAASRLGQIVYRTILEPALRLLKEPVNSLLVVPDGALNLIPLGCAVLPDGRFALEKYSISYLQRATDITVQKPLPIDKQGSVVVAAPNFDQGQEIQVAQNGRGIQLTRDRFTPLPETLTEATEILNIIPNTKMYVGDSATKSQLRKVKQPKILHIATHGFFLPDVATQKELLESESSTLLHPMLRSGLAFTGANPRNSPSGDNGILTAYEAAMLDLYGTELVVLSACETGVGQVENGQGVFGLRLALAMAGAQSLTMSLWKVADRATADLMIDFYTRLKAGEGRLEALRQAQLGILNKARKSTTNNGRVFAHPYFWGAFVMSGQTGRLSI